MAGVRMVTVQTISAATIATYIAAGGLGDIITRGISMIDIRSDFGRSDSGLFTRPNCESIFAWC